MIARVRAKRQKEQNQPLDAQAEETAPLDECCDDGECSLDQMQESFDEIDPVQLVVPEDEVNEDGNS